MREVFQKKVLDLEINWLIHAFPPTRKFGIKHYWGVVSLNANKSAGIAIWPSSFLLNPEDFSLFSAEWICFQKRNACVTHLKIMHKFFTSLGLHFPMLANWYLGECYCAFCLPSMHRQLEFKINPVKFQEWMITFSFLLLNMLVVAQFILSFILSLFDVFPLIFLPPPSGNFHSLAGIQQK